MCSNQTSKDTVISVENINKTYLMYQKPFDRLKQMIVRNRKRYYSEHHVLKDISFNVNRGETVGIVGSNGSGKSTLLQIICSTLTASSGNFNVKGRISALLELGAGFNPEFSGIDNIHLNATILGLSPDEIKNKIPEIESFAAIGDMIHHPVKTYSSGMYVRLAFAVAIATDPDILIVDEALAVGDEAFQRKCFARIREIQERDGTILFVSHSYATIVELCNKAILLDKGELLCSGNPKSVISNYHKLLYAPDDKKESIRDTLKQGMLYVDTTCNNNTPCNKNNNTETVNHFDPELTPETMVSYESNGAKICEPHITTLTGEKTNLLHPNTEYLYKYRVEFLENAHKVKFGMLVKTKSGIGLVGATTHAEGNEIDLVKAGSVVNVQFKFKNLFNHGTYFTNSGCSAIVNGERISIHRILDAFMFKVLPKTQDNTSRGLVDFNVKTSYSIDNTNKNNIIYPETQISI